MRPALARSCLARSEARQSLAGPILGSEGSEYPFLTLQELYEALTALSEAPRGSLSAADRRRSDGQA